MWLELWLGVAQELAKIRTDRRSTEFVESSLPRPSFPILHPSPQQFALTMVSLKVSALALLALRAVGVFAAADAVSTTQSFNWQTES